MAKESGGTTKSAKNDAPTTVNSDQNIVVPISKRERERRSRDYSQRALDVVREATERPDD